MEMLLMNETNSMNKNTNLKIIFISVEHIYYSERCLLLNNDVLFDKYFDERCLNF